MKRHNPSRTLLLAEPISGDTYAIAQMRHHIRKLSEDADALIFVSATVDPFADAELFRRVRLAQQYSEKIEVGVAFDEVAPVSNPAWPTVKAVQQRLERLNCVSIRRVRADLYHDPKGQDIDLFKPTALRAAVTTAVEKARHRAEHGDDGISAGLMADHGAGFAHSHGSGDGEGHSHGHGHNQAHAHFHSHTDR
ncbi:hypothetical protein [Corynebacterium auriscanis]|uniref:hypothetical protein n=1 Tax=Corynebacterium auriscanis TaxID=99807 RepID=UPI0022451479|nr:hypothetical protein [Corynebacterium auriscanis]MCX2162647.1 hypothetical protein [Corynebacterium auriscanis]